MKLWRAKGTFLDTKTKGLCEILVMNLPDTRKQDNLGLQNLKFFEISPRFNKSFLDSREQYTSLDTKNCEHPIKFLEIISMFSRLCRAETTIEPRQYNPLKFFKGACELRRLLCRLQKLETILVSRCWAGCEETLSCKLWDQGHGKLMRAWKILRERRGEEKDIVEPTLTMDQTC